ncbi:MAG: serine/threonine-protein kinase [Myxococcota bacterium]
MGTTRSLRRPLAGKYELTGRLGTGGMAEVWKARHLTTHRPVAVKRISIPVGGDAQVERRFFKEVQLQARVRHPGVADVLDAGRASDASLYLVLEYLEGQDLEHSFRARRLRPRELVRVMVRVLDALSACHAAGIVHRDVKPSNIYLARSPTASFEVKLLDFGIATEVSDHEEEDLIVGTLETMGPEQARGEGADPGMDVYSAASVLFRGLAGVPPIDVVSLDELTRAHEMGVRLRLAALRPDLPADLVEVVDRGLASQPSQRWPSAEAMGAALLACDHRALGRCEGLGVLESGVTASLGFAELAVGAPTEALVPPTVVRRKGAAA